MPEKITRQEKIISLAIEKARLAKEELSAKKRMNIEPTQVKEVDTSVEEVKIKRPKVQDASKITNQTQKKEGYGLAGESLMKSFRFYSENVKQLYEKVNDELNQTRGMKTGKFIKHLYGQMKKQPVLYERDIMNAKQATLSDPRNQDLPKPTPQPTPQPRQERTPEQKRKLLERKKWMRSNRS